MSDGVKEIACTRCIHREVCIYKQDFLDITKAVQEATVHKYSEHTDGRMTMKRVTDYECLGEMHIFCRYFSDY